MREVQRQRHDLLSSLMIGYRRCSEPGRWVLKTCIPVRLITLELANCCSCNVEVCAQNLDPVQSRSVRVMRTRLECMQRLCVVTTMERSSAAVSAVKMERRDWCEAINDDAAADDGVGSASSHVRPSQTADRAVSLPPPIYRQPRERAAELATSPPGRVRSIAISMPVCLCVCPPAYLTNVTFKKLYEYMISVPVAQFFCSDDNAIYTL